jgi:hypothetical protein
VCCQGNEYIYTWPKLDIAREMREKIRQIRAIS